MMFKQASQSMGPRVRIHRTGEFPVHLRKMTIRYLLTIISFLVPMAIYNNARVVNRDFDNIVLSEISVDKSEVALHRDLREQAPVVQSPRAMVGIFSRDDSAGAIQRQHYRTMFETVWNNDPRICNLPRFMEKVKNQELNHEDCLLVYTFVIGAYKPDDTSRPTEIVEDFAVNPMDESIAKPLDFVVDKVARPYSEDVNRPDVTRLSIRENDHDGKSQTFLNFVYRHVFKMEENLGRHVPIEYCVKVDPDTFLSLHRYFHFAQTELLPAPFHRGVLVGRVRDKSYTDRPTPEDFNDPQRPRLESFWGKEFEGIHLYLSGELYILSTDVVEFVLKEVPFSRRRIAPGGYVIGDEGHDVASMAFHSPTPLHLITIGKSQHFWTYPVKTKDDWERLVASERATLSNPTLR